MFGCYPVDFASVLEETEARVMLPVPSDADRISGHPEVANQIIVPQSTPPPRFT